MEYQKLTANFPYGRLFRKTTRHTKVQVATLVGVADFRVKTPTAEEFPLAMTVTRFETRQRGLRSYDDYDGDKAKCGYYKEEIRSIGRKLYKPMRYSSGACLGDTVGDFKYITSMMRRVADDLQDVGYPVDGVSVTVLDHVPYHEAAANENAVWGMDNKAHVVKAIRKHLSDIVYFDGFYWERCAEPRYTYVTFGCCGDGTGFFVDYGIPRHDKRFYFSALQRDEAISTASKVARDRHDTEDAKRIKRAKENIVVYNPKLVTKVR